MSDVTDSDPWIGQVLNGRYRIVERLGEGGVAVVYRGQQVDIGRPVAIKLLHSASVEHEELRGRFEREARALASLSHPHIVAMIDYGVAESMPYLVMELLVGRTLRDLLDEGPLPPERTFAILRQVLRALAVAHAQKLIHRDLKPGNVFLQALPDTADHVKLLDFGFAKFVSPDQDAGPVLTRAGTVFGTPAYMAPEQVTGGPIDPRADVYAAGVLLFEMLTGVKPFDGEIPQMLRQKVIGPAPKMRDARPDLSVRPELDELIARMLGHRDDRPRDAAELLAALDALPQPAVQVAPRSLVDADAVIGRVSPATPLPPSPLPPPAAAATIADPSIPAAPPAPPGPPPDSSQRMPAPFTAQPQPKRSRAGLAIALVAAGALAVLVVCGGAAFLLFGAGEPEPVAAPAPILPPEPVVIVDDPENQEALPVPDPFAADGVPALYTAVLDTLSEGGDVDEATIRELRREARASRRDGRPYLLFGHIYTARAWRDDAVQQYLLAHEIDPALRGDRRMLVNLIALAAYPSSSIAASQAIVSIYGSEALPAIDSALASTSIRQDGAERLRRLRQRIAE